MPKMRGSSSGAARSVARGTSGAAAGSSAGGRCSIPILYLALPSFVWRYLAFRAGQDLQIRFLLYPVCTRSAQPGSLRGMAAAKSARLPGGAEIVILNAVKNPSWIYGDGLFAEFTLERSEGRRVTRSRLGNSAGPRRRATQA